MSPLVTFADGSQGEFSQADIDAMVESGVDIVNVEQPEQPEQPTPEESQPPPILVAPEETTVQPEGTLSIQPTTPTETTQPSESTTPSGDTGGRTTSATIRGQYVTNIAVQSFRVGDADVDIIGVPEVDLANLQAAGASDAEIAAYMAVYGYDYYSSIQAGTDTEATKILDEHGLLNPTTKEYDEQKANETIYSGKLNVKLLDWLSNKNVIPLGVPYYEIGSYKIPVSLWDSTLPQEQFNLLKKVGQIPENAEFVDLGDGKWSYQTGEIKFEVGEAEITQEQLDYLKENEPEIYNYYIGNGLTTTWAKYADKINKAQVAVWANSLSDDLKVIYQEAGGGEEGVNAVIDKISEYKKQIEEASKTDIGGFASSNNIIIVDKNNLSNDELRQLIIAGINPLSLVASGQDINTVNDVIRTIQEDYQKYQEAQNKLTPYGNLAQNPNVQVDIETGKYYDISDPYKPKELASGVSLLTTYTLQDLARFQRENPNDTSTLAILYNNPKLIEQINNYNADLNKSLNEINLSLQGQTKGGETIALRSALEKYGYYNTDILKNNGYTVEGGYETIEPIWIDKNGMALSDNEINKIMWDSLTESQKEEVANKYGSDYFRTNYLAEYNKIIKEGAESLGTWGSVLTSPYLPITNVLAKQITINEARDYLGKQYSNELSVLKNYINSKGLIDIGKLESDFMMDDSLKSKILQDTGYDDYNSLKQNLQYYNNGIYVTAGEWAEAGAVAALDVLMFGGGAALSSLGTAGNLISSGIQIGSGAIFLPSTIQAVKSKDVPLNQKILAIGGEILLVTGGALSLKAPKIPTEKLSPIGKVEVPIKETYVGTGEVWKGVKLGDNPLIGVSKGKITIGKSGIEFPPLEEWKLPKEEGTPFEPRSGLETKVLVNRTALEKAGMTTPEATKFVADIESTLSEVKQFYGKKSPYMSSELLSAPIDTFSKEGVEAILKQVVVDKKIVDRVFGSSTMRPQFSPEAMAEWTKVYGRIPGDIDIMLKGVDAEGAANFAKRLVEKIKAESGDDAWISPERDTLVMARSKSTGAIRHGIDIHYEGEPIENQIPISEFNEMVYGLKKSAPIVKVKVEGIGDISVARLSETGIGKTEQVLGWRLDPETGKVILKTELHRLKDYIDLYEIIKTYNGEEAANRWVSDIGLDLEAFKKIAKETVSDKDYSWEFRPSEDASLSSNGYYSSIINLVSPSILSAISSKVIGYTSSGNLISIPSRISQSFYSIEQPSTSVIYKPSPISTSKLNIVPSVSVSPLISKEISQPISATSEVQPSEVGSQPPSVEISKPPSEITSVPPSSITSIPPSSQSSYYPSLPSPPYYPPPDKFKPKPVPPIEFEEDEAINKKLEKGFITWRQGKTHWAIPQLEDGTFNSDDKVASGKPFRGSTKFSTGKGSVYRTLEYVGKNPPEKAFVDLGWAQYNIVKSTDGVKLVKVTPDETANWEGINKYTTPEAIAEKKYEEQRQRDIKNLAEIEKYKRQYLRRYAKPRKKDDVIKEADKLIRKRPIEEPQVFTAGKHTYLGYEILPSQIGGEL